MPLTNTQVTQSKAKEKSYKLSDSGGLYLEVTKTGSKYWRLKYRFLKKEKLLSIGVYPAISLKQARQARERAKELLAQGIDPSQDKQEKQRQAQAVTADIFSEVAKRWFKVKKGEWSKVHTDDVWTSLERDIFPKLGHIPITGITAPMLLKVLEGVQDRGSIETSKRLRQRCNGIFNYGKAVGVCENNPADGLSEALLRPKKQNYPALSEEELPEYFKAIAQCDMQMQTRIAIKLMTLVFVRSSELREARWDELDMESLQWIIPSVRMKKKDQGDHVVPLSTQAVELLESLREINGHREFLFVQVGNPRKPMSDGTIAGVIKRIGYRGRMTVHGYRSVASSALNESSLFNPDAIERQLHHKERNNSRAAYNRAEYLDERTKMMQWWADKVDALVDGGNTLCPNLGES